jgi:hypothetical protein
MNLAVLRVLEVLSNKFNVDRICTEVIRSSQKDNITATKPPQIIIIIIILLMAIIKIIISIYIYKQRRILTRLRFDPLTSCLQVQLTS